MALRPVLALVALLTALLLALGLSACGGDDGDDEATPPAATETDDGAGDDGNGADGEAIFVANCGTCHTLSAAGTAGQVGPSFDDFAPAQESVEAQVRQGGGGMPSFEGQLSDEEIAAVSQYVAENAGGG